MVNNGGISVIIPIGDGYNGKALQHRWESLNYSLENFYGKHKDIEVVIVCQNTTIPNVTSDILLRVFSGGKENRTYKSIVLRYKVFNKGWCCNVGVRNSRYDNIIIAESDMFCNVHYLHNILFLKKKWCFGWSKLIYTSELQRSQVLRGQIDWIDTKSKHATPRKGFSEGGFVYFKKSFYLSIGGFNEWFEMLGGMDNEIVRRAEHITRDYPKFPITVYHLWHPVCKSSNCQSRATNKAILSGTVRNSAKYTKILSSLNFGNSKRPLCSTASYKSVFK